MLFSVHVLAQGELDTIYNSKNHLEMFDAMKAIDSLSEQVKKVESLTSEQQNNLLTGLFIRRNNPQNLDEFKTFFEEKYKSATTYMAFEPGYPKVEDNGEHGCTMTVLTNTSGYIYIVGFPDNIDGGINGIRQLMEYYRADNELYKKRVYVEAGIEKTFPVSCATYGSGGKYRAYLCLRTENNCYSEFQQIKYQVKKIEKRVLILYKVGRSMVMPEIGGLTEILVCSNTPYEYWESYKYYFYDAFGNITYIGRPFVSYNPYTQVNTYQFLADAEMSVPDTRLIAYNRFYFSNGTSYQNHFILDFEVDKFVIQFFN